MSKASKIATQSLAHALQERAPDYETLALDAIEEQADPDVIVEIADLRVGDKAIRLPALAAAAVLRNGVVARGLLQAGASPGEAHAALAQAAIEATPEDDPQGRLARGLRELGAILNLRIADLERFGRSSGPFSEPFRPCNEPILTLALRHPPRKRL